ncbi:MAG: TetR/AcrR family transcriptional regulator [Nitrospirae bacterium]|nr:TetR/AcrR family transcriptional regulator [Nitrospirota bacterium]
MKTASGKRNIILNTAMNLFSKRPYHRVSMDEIAQKAKVAKGTLYYHFKSKEALYAALLHEGLDIMILRLNERFKRDDPLENLKLFIHELVNFFNEKRTFFLVLQQEEGKLFNKRLSNCYKKICTVKDLLESLLKEAVNRGQIRPDLNTKVLSEIIMGMIKEPVLKGKISPEVHINTIFAVLEGGIIKA